MTRPREGTQLQGRPLSVLDALVHDVRITCRTLLRSPTFVLTVVATLGLGLGVNAAMFDVADAWLLAPPRHISDPASVKRLYLVRQQAAGGEAQLTARLPYVDYHALKSVPGLLQVAAFARPEPVTAGRETAAFELHIAAATHTYFELPGVRPNLGRYFDASEDRPPAGDRVFVLSHSAWLTFFGGAPNAIGQSLELDHVPYTIIGVAPPRLTGVDREAVDAWVPAGAVASDVVGEQWQYAAGVHWLQVVALVARGTHEAQVSEAARQALVPSPTSQFGASPGNVVVLGDVNRSRGPVEPGVQDPRAGQIATWLLAVSTLVLIIATVNVANLMVTRSLRRRRDAGLQAALGVSRRRLVAQFAIESTVLGGAAWLLGALLSMWLGTYVAAQLAPDME